MLTVDQASIYFSTNKGNVVHALDRVSLSMQRQDFLVVLGASGCGKSTLLNALAGFIPLSSGSLLLEGQPITQPGADRGVVFQKDTLFPWKSIIENVELGMKFGGLNKTQRREEAEQLLKLVALSDFASAYPYELSGGMRQRVGIIRALATKPKLLLMDEPLGALDSLTRDKTLAVIRNVWRETRSSIFFITHSLDEALLLGTKLIIMSPRPGRIIARFDLPFAHEISKESDFDDIRAETEFIRLSKEIRSIIHTADIGNAA